MLDKCPKFHKILGLVWPLFDLETPEAAQMLVGATMWASGVGTEECRWARRWKCVATQPRQQTFLQLSVFICDASSLNPQHQSLALKLPSGLSFLTLPVCSLIVLGVLWRLASVNWNVWPLLPVLSLFPTYQLRVVPAQGPCGADL